MKLEDLKERSVLLLGFGTEGQATYEFIRSRWPSKPLIVADKREEVAERLKADTAVTLRLGPDHLKALSSEKYDVIIKTPGIPASLKEIVEAYSRGVALTSHSDIF